MTEQATTSAEESGGTEPLVRTEEGGGQCWVGKGLDGVRCPRPAVLRVYGLGMCAEHGEEARAGALSELYYDAVQVVERLRNPYVDTLNPEASRVMAAGAAELWRACAEAESNVGEVLMRAFPLDRERTCPETFEYVRDPEAPWSYPPPFDEYLRERHLVHKLMRLAYQEGSTTLVETLEPERERAAAQSAYAAALEREAGLR